MTAESVTIFDSSGVLGRIFHSSSSELWLYTMLFLGLTLVAVYLFLNLRAKAVQKEFKSDQDSDVSSENHEGASP
ncbi:MAG: hypothetical protein FWF11_00220 [Coriobacteriia bacterium]|nr:hypothetical protein [Coriobacteriia bacterium]